MTDKTVFKRFAIGIIAIWLVLFALVPNLMVIIASFMTQGESEFIVWTPSISSYQRMLDPLYLQVFWNSFYLSAFTTALCLLIGYPFAYLIARAGPKARPILLLLVIVPFWTSSLVRTYAMIIILNANGLLNSTLLGLGLINEPLQILYTDTAVIAGLVYTLLPFMVLPLYAAIEKLDWRLVEAARDLGARKVRTFVSVIIPLTMPGIVAGSMLVFLPGLGMFYIADFLGGSKTTLIGNLIQRQFLSARDWPFGSAASVTLTVTMGVMIWIYLLSAKRANAKVEV